VNNLIIHELVHMKVPNHGKLFKALHRASPANRPNLVTDKRQELHDGRPLWTRNENRKH
jgi:predicted metal-dependent hydrolase